MNDCGVCDEYTRQYNTAIANGLVNRARSINRMTLAHERDKHGKSAKPVREVTVTATFTPTWGRPPKPPYEKEVRLTFDGKVVKMHGGPTGFESFYIEDFLRNRKTPEDAGWLACFGSNGWPQCMVSAEEMTKAMQAFGYWRVQNTQPEGSDKWSIDDWVKFDIAIWGNSYWRAGESGPERVDPTSIRIELMGGKAVFINQPD